MAMELLIKQGCNDTVERAPDEVVYYECANKSKRGRAGIMSLITFHERQAFAIFGNANYCLVYYDLETNHIGLYPSERQNPNAYKLQRNSSSGYTHLMVKKLFTALGFRLMNRTKMKFWQSSTTAIWHLAIPEMAIIRGSEKPKSARQSTA